MRRGERWKNSGNLLQFRNVPVLREWKNREKAVLEMKQKLFLFIFVLFSLARDDNE
jgi:hypothetical protein